MSAQTALTSLERLTAKYRKDVHQFGPPATEEAISALETHLVTHLPRGLKRFLSQYNGSTLFRGALRIRTVSEMTPASETCNEVTLFADGEDEIRWAWAQTNESDYVFGPWDGSTLIALHSTFEGWLEASIALLEGRATKQDDRDAIRFQSDPGDIHQLVRAGTQALRNGELEEANAFFKNATKRQPNHARAWQYLGETITHSDPKTANKARKKAFLATKLPLPWPGAPAMTPKLLAPLKAQFSDPEKWEQLLSRFLKDHIIDISRPSEFDVAIAIAEALCTSLRERGKRRDARDRMRVFVDQCQGYSLGATPWICIFKIAEIEAALGFVDEAEMYIRQIRKDGPPEIQGQTLLLLATIAVSRQEPWAEDILNEARSIDLNPENRFTAELLHTERALRQDQLALARVHLERASQFHLDHPRHRAALWLAEGDIERLDGHIDAASALYSQALEQVESKSEELYFRLIARLGAIAVEEDNHDQAMAYYRKAAQGFFTIELPVREAWSLMRMAQLLSPDESGRDSLLAAAQTRFMEADHSAGVAMVDAITGASDERLSWHLERASAHARARHDAQRCKPPWARADADRPERRLGAHRLAIAASGESVVTRLARELDACGRAVSVGRARPTDPPVMRFVAVLDLISAHRSFGAAQALLKHLLNKSVEGAPYRALQGALARAPNAALVDGLLACTEHPREYPPHAVAAACEVLGIRRENAAVRPILTLTSPTTSPVIRKAAIIALGRIGDRSAAPRVLRALEDPAMAEHAALTLLMLGDRRGIDYHGRVLTEDRLDLSNHPGEIVGRYGGPDHLLLLSHATKGEGARALGALQGLGLMGDPRAVPTLIQGTGHKNRQVREVAAGALEVLLGHHEDVDSPKLNIRWQTWWESQDGRFPSGVRHREGSMFDAGFLIRQMQHNDPWSRRTAYDELVITTGNNQPFDGDGPWRVQEKHIRTWFDWWDDNQEKMASGHWYLDGKLIH